VDVPPVSRAPLGLLANPTKTTVRLLTAEQVADLLGFGPAGALSVRILDVAGRGPISYPVGTGRVWCRSDVLDWRRENDPAAALRDVAGMLTDLATAFE
jgi:hypothetical protein